MDILTTDTEQLIKDTAKKVFFADGKLHTTTQEIADQAGINRTAIHYYFRSRKQLFDKVLIEALIEMRKKLDAVFLENLTLRARVEKFIETFIERSLEHPYLEVFIITEFNTNPLLQKQLLNHVDTTVRLMDLQKNIDKEVKAGYMKPITPNNFIVTMMSLCSFPFLGKPIIKNALGLDEHAYEQLIAERKQVIMRLLFLDIND